VTHHLPPGLRQRDTHEELVGHAKSPLTPPITGALDAIIVPASRPAANLDHAVTMARATHSRLLVLCSRKSRPDEVYHLLASRSFTHATVIDMPRGYSHEWFDFATTTRAEIDLPEPCATRHNDLSMKRNVGLALARMLGWDRVFFMDDDIRDVNPADLLRTVSMLGRYYSVGMRVEEYPDNSVACHAHRETGKFQGILVGGSALAVDCTAPIGFFPDIYNEDWFFFFDDIAEHRLGASGLNATQLVYDPFDHPQRAARQEFGDLLAEGLYTLLHWGRGAGDADKQYWAYFLDARREFLDAIITRADSARAEVRQRMLASITAAQECLAQIKPGICERYVQIWRADLGLWEQNLKDMPQLTSLSKALSRLGLQSDDDGGDAQQKRLIRADPSLSTTAGSVTIPDVATLNDLPADSVLARLNTMAADAARITLRHSVTPPGVTTIGADVAGSEMSDREMVDAASSRGRLTAAGSFVSLMALLAICLALPGDTEARRSRHGWAWRALSGLHPWRRRSRQMIAAGRDAARVLTSRMRRRQLADVQTAGGQQLVVTAQAESRCRASRGLAQGAPIHHIQ